MSQSIGRKASAWGVWAMAAAAGLALACSSSTSSPPAADAGSSGGQSSGGAGAGGGGGACVTTIGTTKQCSAPMSASMCTQGGGTSASTCPSDGLAGCCQYNGNGGFNCSYDANAAPSAQSQCSSSNGKWTTTVPTF